MHEEALLRDLLRKVEEVARAQGSPRVARVRVWVGALAHFSETGLKNRWSIATHGTLAEGSQLEVSMSLDPNDPRSTELVLVSVDIAGAL